MGVKDLGLFGTVILGGLALGWTAAGTHTGDAASSSDGSPASPEASASAMVGTGGFWPNGNTTPEREGDNLRAAPDPVAEQIRNDARASFRAEMAKSGVTEIRVPPERVSAPAPALQAAAGPHPQQSAPRAASASASAGWSRPTSGEGGWGVQAGVAPSSGPMAPPSRAQQPQESN